MTATTTVGGCVLTEADVLAIVEERNFLARENAVLRQQLAEAETLNRGLAGRVAAQSELLSRRAEGEAKR